MVMAESKQDEHKESKKSKRGIECIRTAVVYVRVYIWDAESVGNSVEACTVCTSQTLLWLPSWLHNTTPTKLTLAQEIMVILQLTTLPCCFASTGHLRSMQIKALRDRTKCIVLYTQGQPTMIKEVLEVPVS